VKQSRWSPSPALAISVLALFVALGGTGYAAFGLPKNSVGTKQLKNGAVTGAKLSAGAVTGAKVEPGSLTGAEINVTKLGTVPTASQATNATHATSADSAQNAASAANAGNAAELGGLQPDAFEHAIPVGGWSSAAGNFSGPSSTFSFAGSGVDVTTTAGQTVVVSGSAALATSAGSAAIVLAVCAQPSGGGALQTLPSIGDDENVTVTTTRLPFAISQFGRPGAGTWKVGICVDDTSATAVNANDYSVGWAMVV
jgi:hypothetical protein